MLQIPVTISAADLDKFKQNPFWKQKLENIQEVATDGLKVSQEELFAYAIFYEWADLPGWRTYDDMVQLLASRRQRFEDYVNVAEKNLKLTRPPVRDIIESIGVGATLALSARILGLTNADFRKIAETNKYSTLDYELNLLSSDGREIFNVEAKGTHDNASLAVHRKSIRNKKADPRRTGNKTNRILQIGVVADLTYQRKKKPTQLYLLDPPVIEEVTDPKQIRLVNRLKYYLTELRWISKGQITTALSQRVIDIELVGDNWRIFDKSGLTDMYGSKIKLGSNIADTIHFLGDVKAHGRIYDLQLKKGSLIDGEIDSLRKKPIRLYFRGLHRRVLLALVEQDFDQILEMQFGQQHLHLFSKIALSGKLELLQSGLVVGEFKNYG